MAASSSSASDNFEEGLNEKQLEAFRAFREGKNICITGQGGTGKSFLIQRIREYCLAKYRFKTHHYVTAFTGAAAILIKGTTFHKWTSLGLFDKSVDRYFLDLQSNKTVLNKWMYVRTLIIDEISMMPSDIFTKFDQLARKIRARPLTPFGGIQVVLSGDFCQLAPIGESASFVFTCDSWKNGAIHTVHLDLNHRQSDPVLCQVLAETRMGKITEESIKVLKSRVIPDVYSLSPISETSGILPTILMAKNEEVDRYNQSKLAALPAPLFTFDAVFKSELVSRLAKPEIEFLRNNLAVPLSLPLKVGAQVMLRINLNVAKELANGSLGVVEKIDPSKKLVHVRFRSAEDELVPISPHIWTREVNEVVTAYCVQLPLSLAWAFTIHKSQGQQFDAVAIDMKNLFAEGQGYTALSRVKTLEGLFISNFNPAKITVSPIAKAFYSSLEAEVDDNSATIKRQRLS